MFIETNSCFFPACLIVWVQAYLVKTHVAPYCASSPTDQISSELLKSKDKDPDKIEDGDSQHT